MSLAVAVPSNCAEAANAADTAVPATFIVVDEVNAVDGSKSTMVDVSETLEAAAVPSEMAPVDPELIVLANVLVVFCRNVAVTPRTKIRPAGKS